MSACDRLFRAEKGTANFNAFRTLLFGVIGCVVILLSVQPAVYLYDRHIREVPWIEAKTRAFISPSGKWAIESYTSAPQRVTGTRTLIQYTVSRVEPDISCMVDRSDSWIGEKMKPWTVEGFMGYDCPIPKEPFFICSEFNVKLESGASGSFAVGRDGKPFCTNLIDPNKASF